MTQRQTRSATHDASADARVPLIPWLDPESAAAVQDIVQAIAAHHLEVQAVILFGSVARREERPVGDPEPSEIDLLLLIDPMMHDPTAQYLTNEQELALTRTIGEAEYRHRALREINTFFMNRDLARCDESFIENVARDGIVLWAHGPVPVPLAPVTERPITAMVSATPR